MEERARLAALAATQLLDTDPDPRFDRITRLAANTLGAKIALVSLVDKDRQWFKSCIGLDISETSREVSFCVHAIEQPDVMVVLDATRDVRFADNPLVTGEPFIRFYAGAPLVTETGLALGTLCIIDTEPRTEFSEREKTILRDLATGVMTEIQNDMRSRQVQDLAVINGELKHRMGNMYAHVSSLISLLDRSEDDRDQFVRRLREKISLLAETQSLLAKNDWQSVSLRELAQASLSPFEPAVDKKMIVIQDDGDFHISPRAAFAMSLLLNELGTNSVKHGALGKRGGQARFSWTQDPQMIFHWNETLPAPRAAGTPGSGFGTRILQQIVPKTFGGKAELDIQPQAFAYSVSALRDRVCITS